MVMKKLALAVLATAAAVAAQAPNALHQTIDYGDDTDVHWVHHLLKFKALLAGGEADINAIGPGGQTPLVMATLMGKTEFVKALLTHGADTSIGEQDGYTPLHAAAFQGRAEVAQLLVDHGLDPLEYHPDGFAPMHRACWGADERHTQTVQVFLDAGVDPNLPSNPTDGQAVQLPYQMVGSQTTLDLLRSRGAIEDARNEAKSEL